MRGITWIHVVGLVLAGCNRAPTVAVVHSQAVTADDPTPSPPPPPPPRAVAMPLPTSELSPSERCEIAVWNAAASLMNHQYPEALASLEVAKRIQDAEQVRQEIARVKTRLEAARTAGHTIRDIQTVLDEGNPEEAVPLAAAAVREFGDSDLADAVLRMKRQADALAVTSLDLPTRAGRFRREGDEAFRGKNLRGAALAYEQCLAAGDATVRRPLAEVQTALSRYDESRRRAADLRHDPGRLEEALAALRAAAVAWDTLAVRQEMDDCLLALRSRRDRIGIADFETHGEAGIVSLGQTVAEELMPAFRGRFDVVDRVQISRICTELHLRGTDLIDRETPRRELARLAKVRYLVVGSVTGAGEFAVQACLLDLNSGLILQSARITGTSSGLLVRLPQLVTMLQMSDDERLAYEQRLAQAAPAVPIASDTYSVPPPPATDSVAPPIEVGAARRPELGGVVLADFDKLPAPGRPPVIPPAPNPKESKVRTRVLAVAVELGDDRFRHGRYAEARAHFQLALSLSPGNPEIVARLNRCKTQPSSTSAGISSRALPLRLAVLDFAGDATSTGLGSWAADSIAPYWRPTYDVVDRGEVDWYMGRLGVTLRDAVVDPLARQYLGRALNVQLFALGTMEATPNGLRAVVHLLDINSGAQLNTATAVAQDRVELKCRLGDIAHWLLLEPAERAREEAGAAETQAMLIQAEAAAKHADFSSAIELAKKAGQKAPSIRAELLLSQFDRQARVAELDAQRRTAWDQLRTTMADATRRQQALATAAEAARVAAIQQAGTINVANRQRQRDLASQQLVIQARAAVEGQNLALAIQLYESALAIDRGVDVSRELAATRTRLDERTRARASTEAIEREAALRQERNAGVARAQARIDAERRQRAAAEKARKQSPDLVTPKSP